MTSFVKQHPVLSYYIVAFTISWGGVLLLLGGPSTLISSTLSTSSPVFMIALMTTLAGPPIAGLCLTGFVDGRAGFRSLLSHLLTWRLSPAWYAIALLTAPVSVTVALIVLSRFSSAFVPGYVQVGGSSLPGQSGSWTFGFALVAGLFTALMEETGWTGFAIPRLTPTFGTVKTGVLVGLLWGAWHFVSNLLGSGQNAQGMPLALYLLGLLFTFLPPFRVLMVWLYTRTQSLLLSILMHASLVTFWLASTPREIAGRELIVWYAMWGAVLWMFVAAVFLLTRRERVHRLVAAAPAY